MSTIETKYQTVTITVPNGATAGVAIQTEFSLETAWSQCEGVAVYIANGAAVGAARLRIGLRSGAGLIYQAPTFIGDWESSYVIPHGERYKAFQFPAAGAKYIVDTIPIVSPGADITVDVVFKLTRKTV